MAVALSDTAVEIVDPQFRSLVAAHLAPAVDGFALLMMMI